MNSVQKLRLRPVRDLLGHEITSEPDWQGPAEALLSLQGKPASDVWTREEFTKLCHHLHNDNGPTRFVMGFRKDGLKHYVRSKKLVFPNAVSWAWSTITKRAKSGLAVVPYAMNKDRLSRWGGMDFDAHDGDHKRARGFAFGAFRRLLNSDLFIVLESSGQGWHVWAISKDFHPVNDWVRLLKSVARFIKAPVAPGVCEILPPDTLATGFGKGMRVPGSWNPATDSLNEIYWENTDGLLPSISRAGIVRDRAQLTDIERNFSFSASSPRLYREWERSWSKQYSITASATRNDQLAGLVGEIFFQVGYGMAQRVVEAQFETKAVRTRATLEEHLASFKSLWDGLYAQWFAALSDAERELFGALVTEVERDAFRIARSYHRKSVADSQPDFPVAIENLGERLGITTQGACELRKKFVALGIIQLTQPCQPNKRAARFKWLLASNPVSPDRTDRQARCNAAQTR